VKTALPLVLSAGRWRGNSACWVQDDALLAASPLYGFLQLATLRDSKRYGGNARRHARFIRHRIVPFARASGGRWRACYACRCMRASAGYFDGPARGRRRHARTTQHFAPVFSRRALFGVRRQTYAACLALPLPAWHRIVCRGSGGMASVALAAGALTAASPSAVAWRVRLNERRRHPPGAAWAAPAWHGAASRRASLVLHRVAWRAVGYQAAWWR